VHELNQALLFGIVPLLGIMLLAYIGRNR